LEYEKIPNLNKILECEQILNVNKIWTVIFFSNLIKFQIYLDYKKQKRKRKEKRNTDFQLDPAVTQVTDL
jgi:hypothetical protein